MRSLLGFLSFALAASASAGPSAPACLTGEVLDLAGRPVSSAGIALLSRDRGQVRSVSRTDEAGAFLALDLAPGSYWLIVERLGFEPELRPIDLGSSESARADVRLAPLATLALRPTGKDDLAWLVRGVGTDPLRSTTPRGPQETTHTTAPTEDALARPVAGRVAWNALASALPSTDTAGPAGNRTEVELGGALTSAARWFVDG